MLWKYLLWKECLIICCNELPSACESRAAILNGCSTRKKKQASEHILFFQTKYTLIDEQDIPLVENYAFEVQVLQINM